jgi:hypothetical protein
MTKNKWPYNITVYDNIQFDVVLDGGLPTLYV